jgi:hypothetical protein
MTAQSAGLPCDCRERIDAQLAEHNTRIQPFFTLGSNRVGMPFGICTAQVEKGRGKPKAMSLFASFCPFCGVSQKPKEQTP